MSSLNEGNATSIGNTFISSVKSNNNKHINLNTTVNDKHLTIKDKIESLSSQLNITKLHSLDGIFNKKNMTNEEHLNQKTQKNKEKNDFKSKDNKEEIENTMLKHQMLIKRKVDDEVSEYSRELSWVPGQFKNKITSYNNYQKDKGIDFKPSPTTIDIFKSGNLIANKKNTFNLKNKFSNDKNEKEDKFNIQRNKTTSLSLNTTSEGNSKIITVEDVKLLIVKLKLIHDPKSLDKVVIEEIKNLSSTIKEIFTDEVK